jgi:adenosylcobinamide-GDP ribazoletransferase
MKDSRIGTFGALALVLVTLMRWSSIAALLFDARTALGIVVVAVVSRVAMLVLMALLPNARMNGLSRLTGRPEGVTVLAALVIGGAIAVVCVGFAAIKLVVLMGVVTLAVGLVAQQKIRGQTGDILGANQQLCEAFGLALLAASVQL